MKTNNTTLILENELFKVGVSSINGSIEELVLKNDPENMNWVLNASDNSWHLSSMNWGLGYLNIAPKHKPYAGLVRWENPSEIIANKDSISVCYEHELFSVISKKYFDKNGCFSETYTITNKVYVDLVTYNLAVYTPFNDNYPDSLICVKKRCNAHIWCGGNVTWINALRMGGDAPHLALVATHGSFSGYEISEKRLIGNNSNIRGAIGLLADVKTISHDEPLSFGWTIFPHNGNSDFRNKAEEITSFPIPEADKYTVSVGEEVKIDFNGFKKLENITLNCGDDSIPIRDFGDGSIASWMPSTSGKKRLILSNGKKTTWVNIQVVDDVLKRIRSRADFIVEHQQVNNLESNLDGAFLIYDNEINATYRGQGDYNEGRERVGMGVLLAKLYQKYPSEKYKNAVLRYYNFVRNKLQEPDGSVRNSSSDDHRRLYNFPWVAWFHLELFYAFNDKKYLIDALDTLRAFYKHGHEFYAINIQVVKFLQALTDVGMEDERNELFNHFTAQGEYIIKRGVDYPSHEVVYEQSIVGPATQFLFELYIVTKDDLYLDSVAPHLKCLEMFNGQQPDFHLNGIAIRHWDGWWFGKRPRWGDTFPHHWSTITANAFHRCWKATDDKSYLKRAKNIVLNNLCLFSDDGRASCAYIYPELIDGEIGRFYDPYANDQDWALVHYLDIYDDFKYLI